MPPSWMNQSTPCPIAIESGRTLYSMSNDPTEEISPPGLRLRQWRKDNGLIIRQVADALELGYAAYSSLERGVSGTPWEYIQSVDKLTSAGVPLALAQELSKQEDCPHSDTVFRIVSCQVRKDRSGPTHREWRKHLACTSCGYVVQWLGQATPAEVLEYLSQREECSP